MTGIVAVMSGVTGGVGVGVASALVPVVNAEAALAGAGLRLSLAGALGVGLALAVGQTIGKVLLFEAARRGGGRFLRHAPAGSPPREHPAWQRRLLRSLDGRWQANSVVLLSAGVGLPPLAVVSIAAGAVRARRADFVVCCLMGRTVRFVTLAGALVLAW